MIISRSYTTTPGTSILRHSSLNGADVLNVKRGGLCLKRVGLHTTPVNDQFHVKLNGSIVVNADIPFERATGPATSSLGSGEKIWVLYEI